MRPFGITEFFSLVLPVSLLTVFRSLFEQANKQKYSRFS